MEKSVNRDKFVKEFLHIVGKIKYDKLDKFIQQLKKHKYFEEKYKEVLEQKEWQTDREKVIFVLSEMTRERSTCCAIIQMLTDTGNKDVAKIIEKFNKSLDPLPFCSDTNITVEKVCAPKKNVSMTYPLWKKQRGKCIIINNVEEQQSPDVYVGEELVFSPKGLENETKRLKNVFEQLFFEVQVLTKKNAIEIKTELEAIRDEQISKEDEAFVLFVISHGQDEKILGYNACDFIRQINYEEIEDTHPEANRVIREDAIDKRDIIDIFSETHCKPLKNKPKLYFFICCRHKSSSTEPEVSPKVNPSEEQMETDIDDESSKPKKAKTSSLARPFSSGDIEGLAERPNNTNNNNYECIKFKKEEGDGISLDTFVSYACSEGFRTYFDWEWGMTYFTQALTLSIAQYACDENLTQVLARTLQRLEDLYKQKKDTEHWTFGSFAIEVRRMAMKRELYFNPGSSE